MPLRSRASFGSRASSSCSSSRESAANGRSDMVTAGILLVWLLLTLVAIVATAGWLGRLWRRREYLSLRTRIVDTVCAALVMAGALGTILGLVKAFGALGESVDSSRRTRILEE